MLTPTETKQAKSFLKANLTYISPEISHKKYYNNLQEVDARKAGSRAHTAFINYSRKLAQAFNGESYREMFDLYDGTNSRIIKNLKNKKVIQVGIFDITGRAAKT